MSDIKLFRLDGGVTELTGQAVAVERDLQTLMERNLETFLGVRFLASEYSTGQTHRGRIDSLGLDENGSPVIIEYKRSTNENVINQGLFYLDWLLDHQAEFTMLAMKALGPEVEGEISWGAPRLICIAGDFNRYDEHAVSQINRNIELLRYRKYANDFLLLELVNVVSASSSSSSTPTGGTSTAATTSAPAKTVLELLAQAPDELQSLFTDVEAACASLGDEVQRKELKHYIAFKRLKNFACIEVHPSAGKLVVYLKVDPDTVELADGFTRDVRSIGHFGTGDLEVTIRSGEDLNRARDLLERSYESS